MVLPRVDGAFRVPQVAGHKRPAPQLLPAFEPTSSSPKLPRLLPEESDASNQLIQNYLPSAPTSSTYLPTSPPPRDCTRRRQRPDLQRTVSSLSERAPLATLPSVVLDRDGQPTLMGRSSTSSHHQLSTNKLISRVHIRALFVPGSTNTPNQVQVKCVGWNGVKIHCQGKAWDLFKGDTFTSETEDADLLVDVHDSRVLLKWPHPERKVLTPTDSEGTWDEDNSPSRPRSSVGVLDQRISSIQSPRLRGRPRSPVSPTSRGCADAREGAGDLFPRASLHSPVKIYEDEESIDSAESLPGQQRATNDPDLTAPSLKNSISATEVFHESDEENDPIIHSFGPYGDNLNGRLEALSSGRTPETRSPLQPIGSQRLSPQRRQSVALSSEKFRHGEEGLSLPQDAPCSTTANLDHVVNFAVNHLMYSQLSTTPISLLLQHVQTHLSPARQENTLRREVELSAEALEAMLESLPCIGSVSREGKDAAGKRLETEYYYVPEQDVDVNRREVVQALGMGGRGLRSCRKNHKQYYWRKPR